MRHCLFIRRYFRSFSTLAIFSCFYLMLRKTTSISKIDINYPAKGSETLLTIKNNALFRSPLLKKTQKGIAEFPNSNPTRMTLNNPQIASAVSLPSTVIQKIENLPTIGALSMDSNRTLNWLDLWSNDTFCNRFTVHLLEANSVQPRALVSFPGSGNTWLRMLLMGVTGLYVDTIYPGDELFHSKGVYNYYSYISIGYYTIYDFLNSWE